MCAVIAKTAVHQLNKVTSR